MNEKGLLTCPNCESTWFNQVQVGQFQYNSLNFVKPVPFSGEKKVTYICAECGYTVDSLEEPNKMLMIITGNSEGQKRVALHDAGMEALEWEDYTQMSNIVFVTDDAKQNKWDQIEPLFEGSIVHYMDISDGNYDPEELSQGVAEIVKEGNET